LNATIDGQHIYAAGTFVYTDGHLADYAGVSLASSSVVGAPNTDPIPAFTAGADLLIGLGGNELLTGGAGSDTFVFSAGSGADTITDFSGATGEHDIIQLTGFGYTGLADILTHATQTGEDLIINMGGGDSITLAGVSAANLHAEDFSFA